MEFLSNKGSLPSTKAQLWQLRWLSATAFHAISVVLFFVLLGSSPFGRAMGGGKGGQPNHLPPDAPPVYSAGAPPVYSASPPPSASNKTDEHNPLLTKGSTVTVQPRTRDPGSQARPRARSQRWYENEKECGNTCCGRFGRCVCLPTGVSCFSILASMPAGFAVFLGISKCLNAELTNACCIKTWGISSAVCFGIPVGIGVVVLASMCVVWSFTEVGYKIYKLRKDQLEALVDAEGSLPSEPVFGENAAGLGVTPSRAGLLRNGTLDSDVRGVLESVGNG